MTLFAHKGRCPRCGSDPAGDAEFHKALEAQRTAVQAPAPAQTKGTPAGYKLLEDGKTMIPEDWTPLRLEWEPGYPEDVACGPVRAMERLKKWLDAYFVMIQQRMTPATHAPAPEVHQDGWNEPYNCLAAGPTATDVALHQAMNEAAKVGNRDDDKLIRKALNDAGYYLVRSMKRPGTCEHLLANPSPAVKAEPVAEPIRCPERVKNGGTCPHHNLHCGWPACNKESA